jgi:hypothetical protein
MHPNTPGPGTFPNDHEEPKVKLAAIDYVPQARQGLVDLGKPIH